MSADTDHLNQMDSLVGSGASSSYFEPVLDVGGSPLNYPATLIQSDIANGAFPFALVTDGWKSTAGWNDVVPVLEKASGAELCFEAKGDSKNCAYFRMGDRGAIVLDVSIQWWDVTVAGVSREEAVELMDGVMGLLPSPPPPPPEPLPWNVIPVHFWMQDPLSGSAYSRRRNITVQSWEEISDNYPSACRDELSALMSTEEPAGGKLVLLHGPPGSGKTRSILSLMSEWRDWCVASVVTDSDRLFNDATYLNSIIFDAPNSGWVLLVIEDGDEFINVSGRDTKGQSISRLLNLADGIVGQGINLLTLISTNVNVKELNPAVVRPGRCMANISVGPFPADEAVEWCEAHDIEAPEFDGPVSLAELYRLANGGEED